MKRSRRNTAIVLGLVALAASAYILFSSHFGFEVGSFKEVNRNARIEPDYSGIVVPPNIAPLNFKIDEDGSEFFVEIASKKGEAIKVFSRNGKINIPLKEWHELLENNRGQQLEFNIYCKNDTLGWQKYNTIHNSIAREKIDPYLAYRLIAPGYILWGNIGLYQRDIENFDEDAFVNNRGSDGNCMNCHSFNKQDPDEMMFHVRAQHGGTVIIRNGKIEKVNTKIPQTISAGVYPSWHPSGRMIAFSVNKIGQYFHAVKGKSKEVLDFASDIIVYDIDKNTVSSTAPLVTKDSLETFPNWSPDGKYLYYCSAVIPDSLKKVKNDSTNQFRYDLIKYSLMRIPYDIETGKWGKPQMLVSSEATGKSVSFPRVSPDNRYVMFCLSDYGNFSINHKSSDLYLYDIRKRTFVKPDVNSDQTDSFHSWSGNSRWFVFSSKRDNGLFARPYICYFDENGNTGKPFVLPQKDPDFYGAFLKSYNVPELIKGRINVNSRKLYNAVNSDSVINATLDPGISMDAFSGATAKVTVK